MPATRSGLALLEREQEIERIEAAIGDAVAGSGSVVVVEGEPGVGKTSLLRVATELAADGGLRRLLARGAELEREFAFGVVRQLFEPVLAELSPAKRRRVLSGAAAVAAPLVDVRHESHTRGAVGEPLPLFHGLHWLTANVASAEPLLVCVDDAHWADGLSLGALAYLGRRIDELPAVLIVGTRLGEPGATAAELEALRELAGDTVVRPQPLSDAAVTELVERELGEGAASEFCRACHTATAGNPLFVVELLRDLADEGVTPAADQAGRVAEVRPEAVARGVLVRLARLSDQAGALARALAVLGDGTELPFAAALSGLGESEAAESADELAAAFILAPGLPLRFSHPILRSSVYDDFSEARLASEHARAAGILAAAGTPSEQVAVHLLATPAGGDESHAAVLHEAGLEAARKGAPEPAISYLSRALDEGPRVDLRPRILLELGKAEARSGAPDAAFHLEAAFSEARTIAERAEAMDELVKTLVLTGRSAEAFGQAKAALETEEWGDREIELSLEATLVEAALGAGHDALSEVRARLEALVPDLTGDIPVEPILLAHVASLRTMSGERPVDSVPLVERALAHGLTDQLAPDSGQFFSVLAVLLGADRVDLAEPVLDRALRRARAEGSARGFAIASMLRANVAYRRGSLTDVEADVRAALGVAAEVDWSFFETLTLGLLIHVLAEQGRFDKGETLLAEQASGLDGQKLDVPNAAVLVSRGRLRVAAGNYAGGLDDLKRAGPVAVGGVRDLWRGPASRALLALGRRDEALALAKDQLATAEPSGVPRLHGAALRDLGVVTGGAEGIALLEQAVERLADSPAKLELAHGLVALGSALRRTRRRADSRKPLREGLDLAHRCAAWHLEERAREELAATGARPRRALLTGVDALTASERRVAGLAADGMTNSEIAQALFVTRKTVEMHLRHAYQKLGISSRRELPGVGLGQKRLG